MLSITLKIAVDAPIPRASVTIATAVNPRLCQSVRRPKLTSFQELSSMVGPHVHSDVCRSRGFAVAPPRDSVAPSVHLQINEIVRRNVPESRPIQPGTLSPK